MAIGKWLAMFLLTVTGIWPATVFCWTYMYDGQPIAVHDPQFSKDNKHNVQFELSDKTSQSYDLGLQSNNWLLVVTVFEKYGPKTMNTLKRLAKITDDRTNLKLVVVINTLPMQLAKLDSELATHQSVLLTDFQEPEFGRYFGTKIKSGQWMGQNVPAMFLISPQNGIVYHQYQTNDQKRLNVKRLQRVYRQNAKQ